MNTSNCALQNFDNIYIKDVLHISTKAKKNIYHYVLNLLMLSIFITSLYESTQQVYKNEKNLSKSFLSSLIFYA